VLTKNQFNLKLIYFTKEIGNQDECICNTLPKLSGWMSKTLLQGRKAPGNRDLALRGRRPGRSELGGCRESRRAQQGSKEEIAVGRILQACTGA
jgi:hypothetical protein